VRIAENAGPRLPSKQGANFSEKAAVLGWDGWGGGSPHPPRSLNTPLGGTQEFHRHHAGAGRAKQAVAPPEGLGCAWGPPAVAHPNLCRIGVSRQFRLIDLQKGDCPFCSQCSWIWTKRRRHRIDLKRACGGMWPILF